MDIVGFITGLNWFDLLVGVFLGAMFVLGFIQGSVRRLVGILSIVFSFFLAAQLSVPFGNFLADHWTQYPREYSVTLGFLAIFIAAVVAFSLLIQGTYQRSHLFADHPVVDEVLGGILGIVQGLLILMFLTIILDQYFVGQAVSGDLDELPYLREVWTAMNSSEVGSLLHQTVIPNFLRLVSFLVPASVLATYGLA